MMELGGNNLSEMLISGEINISNITFNIETPLNIDISKITIKNKFINCNFKGHRIDFLNLKIGEQDFQNHILIFEN